jgi:hypothetical protein
VGGGGEREGAAGERESGGRGAGERGGWPERGYLAVGRSAGGGHTRKAPSKFHDPRIPTSCEGGSPTGLPSPFCLATAREVSGDASPAFPQVPLFSISGSAHCSRSSKWVCSTRIKSLGGETPDQTLPSRVWKMCFLLAYRRLFSFAPARPFPAEKIHGLTLPFDLENLSVQRDASIEPAIADRDGSAQHVDEPANVGQVGERTFAHVSVPSFSKPVLASLR